MRLKYFLDTVCTLYETYGVKFEVKHNYTSFMRMITPFELLSRFQVVDNSEILSEGLISKMMDKASWDESDDVQEELEWDQENEENYANED